MKKIRKFFASISLKKLSTPPRYESYMWGNNRSLFATLFYGLIYYVRFISPLQLVKAIFRAVQESDLNDKKERKDFHSLHTEIYLLSILLISAAQVFLAEKGLGFLPKWIMIILLIESIFWTFYYMLFRVLIEKHLSIFNEAEYFLSLPIVLVTQFLLFAALNQGVDLSNVVATVFNISNNLPTLPLWLSITLGVLGFTYTAIIIANVINLLPPLPVWQRPNITIIGAGDLVKNRLLDALVSEQGDSGRRLYKPHQLAVASDYIDSDFRQRLDKLGIQYYSVRDSQISANTPDNERNKVLESIVAYVKKRSSYAIIASPPDTHLALMSELASAEIIFAVEKPIVATSAELEYVTDANSRLMKQGFLLSYYWLEKALPINYFLSLNTAHRKYLDIKKQGSDENLSVGALDRLKQRLGKPTHVQIEFYEGPETRPWALQADTGGFFLETFIHPMSLLLNFVPGDGQITYSPDSKWLLDEAAQQSQADTELGASFIHLLGEINQCQFEIKAGKFTPLKRRTAKLTYTHGIIHVDLDSKSCTIILDQSQPVEIKVKQDYQGNYFIQAALFDEYIRDNGEWIGPRFDDFPGQIKVLQQMFTLLSAQGKHFYQPQIVKTTDLELS
ncbi:hypothetical protein [Paraglaciecola aestuariivivens]